ncbi:MAG: hypothetical protein K2I24_08815 [Duncaniella sp.]|nr:hypothetical protein [Duncaniella sp.]
MLSFNINTPILRMIPGLLYLALATSCHDNLTSGSDDVRESYTDEELFETSDLSLFELRHRVKRVTTTTFYNVIPGPDSIAIDTTAVKPLVTTVYFDQLGHYVPRRDERVKRDEWGRIIRWEDRRPNLRRLHGGFLKDTLTYRHDSPNVVRTSGMGDYAVTVYDNNRRVVGQYTDPLADGEHTAVFNLYRNEDRRGNWTERLSVWTTQTPGSRPHVSYSLDRRDIVYY